jgi:hypothetical protein
MQRLQQALDRLPKVSGPGAPAGRVHRLRLNDVLNAAEAEAKQMKDEYVTWSTLLALARPRTGWAEVFRAAGLTVEKP